VYGLFKETASGYHQDAQCEKRMPTRHAINQVAEQHHQTSVNASLKPVV